MVLGKTHLREEMLVLTCGLENLVHRGEEGVVLSCYCGRGTSMPRRPLTSLSIRKQKACQNQGSKLQRPCPRELDLPGTRSNDFEHGTNSTRETII